MFCKIEKVIAKYLKDTDREDFLKRLQDLYSLRSKIVHGNLDKLSKIGNINDLRPEVINIGLDCLKQLLKDDKLLKMKATERVKHILVFDYKEDPSNK